MKLRWTQAQRAKREWFYLRLRQQEVTEERVAALRKWADETVTDDWMHFVHSYYGYAIFAFAREQDAVLAHVVT